MSSTFFEIFKFESIATAVFDSKIAEAAEDELVCVFFWGHDCPNCEIAKKVLVDRKLEVDGLRMKWYQANVYEDFELATRFGLFGIPVFLFFKNGKKLGKTSPFPGFDPFYDAVSKLI
jgi:thioredoxin-like negative regulator of GroEL